MTTKERYNFFALLGTDARRIVTEQKLQEELTTEFVRQRDELLAADEEVEFSGRYRVEEDEIFYIPDFPLPEEIRKSVQNPLQVSALDRDSAAEWDDLKSIYGGRWNGGDPEIVFQSFDRRRSLARRWSLIMRGDAFARLGDPGLVLDTRAVAVLRSGKLYFRSYADARRVLDLTKFYREATDADVAAFTKIAQLEFEDAEQFVADADATVRKRVLFIEDVLKKASPQHIAKTAKTYDVPITIRKGKVVVPRDKKEMKVVLRFLEENYYTSDLTKTKYVSSAKRAI